jgi:predicted PurR-regulated permease PerM
VPRPHRNSLPKVLERAGPRPESYRVAEQPLPKMGYYARITITVALVAGLLSAAWSVRNILLLVLIAGVLAVGLDPPVRRLQRLGIPRGSAVALIFLATIGFLVAFGFLVVPPLVREAKQLATDIPDYVARLKNDSGWVGDLERKYHISTRLKEVTEKLPSIASSSITKVLGITKSIASVIFNMLTIAILTIYFLMALPRAEGVAGRLVSRRGHEAEDTRTLQEATERVGGYVSGNIAVSIIAGVTSFIFLRIFGIPFAAALAMWVGIADLIPTVGATLGALAAVLVAFFSSITDGIATIIFFVIYQQVENYVVVPRVMRKAVDLSPATVIVSVLIGGSLAGFAGALLALPLAAAAKVVLRDLWLRDRLVRPPQAEVGQAAEPTTPGA